ncbi:SDR family NAD(P)-dependent oxidoreductase [Sorangium sp. So ce1128]
MRGIEDQVVVITGGTSGIGRACAARFAGGGAHVVVAGRRRELGETIARAIGERAMFVPADVTREADIKGLLDAALDRHGRIDCVISNAGTGSATTSIPETAPADFDRDLVLHVRAPFLVMKHASPSMIRRGKGSFINMSSISGRMAGFNTFGYEVAKAALVHLTRCAALELGEKGVRVNAISPGPTLTGIFGKHVGNDAEAAEGELRRVEAAFEDLLPAVQPLRGMIRAEDIANAALFLASDEARYINGHDLVVDGGICAGRPATTMRASWEALSQALQISS